MRRNLALGNFRVNEYGLVPKRKNLARREIVEARNREEFIAAFHQMNAEYPVWRRNKGCGEIL